MPFVVKNRGFRHIYRSLGAGQPMVHVWSGVRRITTLVCHAVPAIYYQLEVGKG